MASHWHEQLEQKIQNSKPYKTIWVDALAADVCR